MQTNSSGYREANGDGKASTDPLLRHSLPKSQESFMCSFDRTWKRLVAWLGLGPGLDVLNDSRWHGKKLKYVSTSDHKQGYGRLATWLASDPNFAMGRNYADLRVRVRLHKQHKVEALKTRLRQLDQKQYDIYPRLLVCNEDGINADHGERDKLMQELDQALREHDELALREKEFAALARPSKRNYNSLLNSLYVDQDVCQEEESYFLYPDQMVSLANGTDNSWLDAKVEAILDKMPFAQKIFTPQHLRGREKNETHYYSKERIEILSKAIAILVAALLLVIPITVLYEFDNARKVRLALTLTFVIGFPIFLAACTRSNQQEIFAISAAYCAVLVVFLSNFQSTPAPCNCPPPPHPSG